MKGYVVGLLTWEWKFYIAPAPIIEKQHPNTDREVLYRHWGMYLSKKTYRGFKHPVAGDVVDIPNYGPCKVERILYWVSRPSRSYTLGVVISPQSIGDSEWWLSNRNHPVSRFGDSWSFDMDLPKVYFNDLKTPPNGPLA